VFDAKTAQKSEAGSIDFSLCRATPLQRENHRAQTKVYATPAQTKVYATPAQTKVYATRF